MEGYLEQLASAEPTPGGGSAAAVVAALAASLVAMVARVTLRSERQSSHHDAARSVAERADELRARLLVARGVDEAAYRAVVAAGELPRDTEVRRTQRAAALAVALEAAAEAPLEIACCANDVLAVALDALMFSRKSIASDVGCAAEFAAAGVAAAALNVRINHRSMKDAGVVRPQAQTLESLERETHERLSTVRDAVAALLG